MRRDMHIQLKRFRIIFLLLYDDIWVVLQSEKLKSLMIWNRFYTSWTLRVCNDHSYSWPCQWNLLTDIDDFILYGVRATGSSRWGSVYGFFLYKYTGEFLCIFWKQIFGISFQYVLFLSLKEIVIFNTI